MNRNNCDCILFINFWILCGSIFKVESMSAKTGLRLLFTIAFTVDAKVFETVITSELGLKL